MMPSSGFVGCQSMGWRRASNLDERPSFHLRKTVQRMATPPTTDATTMSTVNHAVLAFVVDVLPETWGVELSLCTEALTVLVTVDLEELTTSLSSSASAVVVGAEMILRVAEVSIEDTEELVLVESALDVVLVAVSEDVNDSEMVPVTLLTVELVRD